MEEKDERRKLENKTQAIIDYFKLIVIAKLTKNSNYSTFKMLGGEKLYYNTVSNIKDGYLDNDQNNRELISKLGGLLEELSTGSISNIYTIEFSNLNWLEELNDICLEESIVDTIIKYSSKEVYYKLLNKSKLSSFVELSKVYIGTNVDNIKFISKKFKHRI